MSEAKPRIGLNMEFRPGRSGAPALSWVNTGYYDSVTACGGLPMAIPPLGNDADLRDFLSLLDGLVLVGCALDLDPVRLGLDPHPVTKPMPSRREDFDRRLARLAAELKIPTLAIGSGMQVLNVVLGGSVVQHIPEVYARALQHRDTLDNCNRHILEIVPGTRMDQIYGPGEIRVNSQHHMSVGNIASPFRVCATAPDGVIEAYESVDDDWFCLGIQWHPESDTASALDMQVFETFMQHCFREDMAPIVSINNRHVA